MGWFSSGRKLFCRVGTGDPQLKMPEVIDDHSLSCLDLSLLGYFSESLLPSFQLNRTFETYHKGNMLTVR